MNATKTKSVNVHGDVLTIEWAGSVWVSPVNGQQHSTAREAMQAELRAYFSSCGEPDSDEIDGYLEQMS